MANLNLSLILPLPVACSPGCKTVFITALLPTVGPQTESGRMWKPAALTLFLEVLGTGLETATAQLFGKASLAWVSPPPPISEEQREDGMLI